MKKFLSLLTAVVFAGTALLAQAATPRAAEEPSATVISTDTPAPRPQKSAKASHGKKKHSHAAKKSGTKKHGKKHAAKTGKSKHRHAAKH